MEGMEGLIVRFQKVIDHVADGNRSLFSRETGKAPSFATDVCKGRTLPTVPYLMELARQYHISLDWLLLGVGEMELAEAPRPEPTDVVHIPRYDVRVSAGHGAWAQDSQPIEQMPFQDRWLRAQLGRSADQMVLVSVEGDSMEPTLEENDLLLIDRQQTGFDREGIYVIRLDEMLMVKRLQRQPKGVIQVISDNPNYPPIHLTPDSSEDFEILGRAIWFGRVF
jgi:phage repressor protein C with HTH and peptisase S24 domain